MARFLNTRHGYSCRKVKEIRHWYWFCPTCIYLVELPKEPSTMLMFSGPDGLWRPGLPGTAFESDMGSVPWLGQAIVGKDEFLLSFFFHDYAWGFGGLYHSTDRGVTWTFVHLTKQQANAMLRDDWLVAEGCGAVRREIIYAAVEAGAVCGYRQDSLMPAPAVGLVCGWSEISDALNKQTCKAIREHVAADPRCEWCGNIRVSDLTAHHIQSIHDRPDLCCDDTNLVTLCRKCHLTTGHLNDFRRINPVLLHQIALQPQESQRAMDTMDGMDL